MRDDTLMRAKKDWVQPTVILISRGSVNSGTLHNLHEATLVPGKSVHGNPTVHTPAGVGTYPASILNYVS